MSTDPHDPPLQRLAGVDVGFEGYAVVGWESGFVGPIANTAPQRIAEIDAAVERAFADRVYAHVLTRLVVVRVYDFASASALYGVLKYIASTYPGELNFVISPVLPAGGLWAGLAYTDWNVVNAVTGTTRGLEEGAEWTPLRTLEVGDDDDDEPV